MDHLTGTPLEIGDTVRVTNPHWSHSYWRFRVGKIVGEDKLFEVIFTSGGFIERAFFTENELTFLYHV